MVGTGSATTTAESTRMDDLTLDHIYGQIFDAEDLCDVGAYDHAIELCDEVLSAWGDSDHEEVFEAIAGALQCRGRSLGGLGRFEEELPAYDEIVRRFGSNASGPTVVQVAEARFNAAVVTTELGLLDESIRRYASFVDRYQASSDPDIRSQVIRAHYNWAVTLKFSQREEEALSRFNELVTRYGKSDEPEYEATVVRALVSKAGLELLAGRHGAAIESAMSGIEKCDAYLSEEQFHCHLILAGAYLLSKDLVSGEKQIAALLDLLPEIEKLPVAENFSFVLRDMAAVIGSDRALELIRNSPATEILAPVVQTLHSRVGRESDRLQSIEETAKTLVTDLAWFDRPDQ